MTASPAFTLGIEEEYLLVDRASRDLVQRSAAGAAGGMPGAAWSQVTPEFLRSQIEVGTRVCSSLAEARADLAGLRQVVAEVTASMASPRSPPSTHPFAYWHRRSTPIRSATTSLAPRPCRRPPAAWSSAACTCMSGSRIRELRIDLMGQLAYFLPHLLALSTSSPFWEGEDTGLKSYRIAVFDELPRTGLPELFDSWGEYERHLAVLVRAGLIEDGSKLWWDMRPSARFPTLEMRVTDVCTRSTTGSPSPPSTAACCACSGACKRAQSALAPLCRACW